MRKFKGIIENGLCNCDRYFEFEVEEDATEEQVEEAAREAMHECLVWNFWGVK